MMKLLYWIFAVFFLLYFNQNITIAQSGSVNNDFSNTLLKKMENEKIRGIYLFNAGVDIDSFFTFCQEAGVNLIFTFESLYFNRTFLNEAQKRDISICLNFPVFFNQAYLEEHPEDYCITNENKKAIQDWLHFACPSSTEYLQHQKAELKKMLEFVAPDMVSFDFIRFFVFWERVYPETSFNEIVDGCYCPKCIKNFEKYSGLDIGNKSAEWIKQNYLEEWANWKCKVIGNVVEELSKIVKEYNKDLPIGLKLVPWRENDFKGAIRSVAGQDINLLKKYVDLFMPMTFSHMVKREPVWIHNLCEEIQVKTGKKITTCIEVEKTYVENEISEKEFNDMLLYGSEKPSSGIILFHFDYILNSSKQVVLSLNKINGPK